ncbi:hypothetical protein LX36DRAFT_78656 [Colletotrichum falcatum]|nr:hypothetical protein LX36DRAFT_78656 [Colletotrichum falcatum]
MLTTSPLDVSPPFARDHNHEHQPRHLHPSPAVPDTSSAAPRPRASRVSAPSTSPARHHDRDSAFSDRDHNNAKPPQRARPDRSMIPAALQHHA